MKEIATGRTRAPWALMFVVLVGLALLAANAARSGNAGDATAAVPVPAQFPVPATGPNSLLPGLGLYRSRQEGEAETSTFSASTDNQVNVRMRWDALALGTHDAYITFYSPDGRLYQLLDVAFDVTTPPPMKGQQSPSYLTVKRPGSLNPVSVQVVMPGPGGTAVWGGLPLAGTSIGRLPGRWLVEVRLDDQSAPPSGSAKFDLTP
jgi:hypothetical protein